MFDNGIIISNDNELQKIYLICNELEFHPDSHLLRSRTDERETSLFTAAARCLEILLQRQGELVPQREIMAFAWGAQGLVVSPNTFYQNISILRKALAEFLPGRDIIITTKRVGLTIPAGINVTSVVASPLTPSEESSRLSTERYSPSVRISRVQTVSLTSDPKNVKKIWLPVWLFAFLLSGIFIKYSYQRDPTVLSTSPLFRNYVLYKKNDKHCALYVNNNAGQIDIRNRFLRKEASVCKSYDNTYITLFESIITSSAMYCSAEKNNSLSCISEYFSQGDK